MKTKLMRKLVLAAAVAALALGARAEVLYWSATGIESSPDTTLSGASQYLAYIFADTGSGPDSARMFDIAKNPRTTYSTVLDRLVNKQDITDLAFYNAKGTGNWAGRDYETTKGRLNNYTAASETASYDAMVGWIGTGGTVNLFAVILDGATFKDSKNYMIATTAAGKQVLTQNTTDNSEPGKTAYFEWGSQANNSWHAIGTIPEPTSGLLLLVGVAALALRRKHAA